MEQTSFNRDVNVRGLISLDADRIIEIIKGLPEWFTPDALTQVKDDMRGMKGFVVVVSGVVRGFILLDDRDCCIEIAWLAVERDFHGRGLGSLLVHVAEEYACKKGKRALAVKTYGGMDYEPYMRTLEFYIKTGFKIYEIIDNYQPFNGQPAVILLKVLDCNGQH